MMSFLLSDFSLEIRPLTDDDLAAVLDVYRQCEDFLALGPVPDASLAMVLGDIGLSRACGGLFCGVHMSDGRMIGIVDYVPGNYEGDPHAAYISLLMIAAPFRRQGVGQAALEAIEREIRRDAQVSAILAGVQVNNPQAIRFWQRNGYRIVGGPELMPDRTTVYHLRKDLTLPIAPEPITHRAARDSSRCGAQNDTHHAPRITYHGARIT